MDVGGGYHYARRDHESSKAEESKKTKHLRCKGGNTMYLATPN